ncbi:MAG: hypothetical protein QOH81_1306 [Sphingomonadales bacterium]|jgi:hypothetical protein|nr:hypothetical protein [Sphingomonadales bacterium]
MGRIGTGRWRIAAASLLALAAPALQGNVGRLANLESRLLAAHNRERGEAGLPPLLWDESLAADAAPWAAHLARMGTLDHEEDADEANPEGENLWLGTNGHYSPEDMVGLWIAEKKHFRPGIFPDNSRTGDYEDVGHYTQLMWRTTGRVGCALAKGTEDEILVCRYRQAGNVEGERPF